MEDSFSTVSKPSFANKYSFCSISEALPHLRTYVALKSTLETTSVPLQTQNVNKRSVTESAILVKIQQVTVCKKRLPIVTKACSILKIQLDDLVDLTSAAK